jgi:curved DNA-binding protein CbpA
MTQSAVPVEPEKADKKEENYYTVLNVACDAPAEEVKRAFHAASLSFHPDKRYLNADDPVPDSASTGNAAADYRWHEAKTAWRCLQDPARRILYNRRNRLPLPAELEPLVDQVDALLREQAKTDVRNMQVEVDQVVQEEGPDGLMILKALYGNLRCREDCCGPDGLPPAVVTEDMLEGPFQDVTSAVQCLVYRNKFIYVGGATRSKADLAGFYDPMALERGGANYTPPCLYVAYSYRCMLSETTVDDKEDLWIPRSQDRLPDRVLRGPCPSDNALRALLSGAGGDTHTTPVARHKGSLARGRPKGRKISLSRVVVLLGILLSVPIVAISRVSRGRCK